MPAPANNEKLSTATEIIGRVLDGNSTADTGIRGLARHLGGVSFHDGHERVDVVVWNASISRRILAFRKVRLITDGEYREFDGEYALAVPEGGISFDARRLDPELDDSSVVLEAGIKPVDGVVVVLKDRKIEPVEGVEEVALSMCALTSEVINWPRLRQIFYFIDKIQDGTVVGGLEKVIDGDYPPERLFKAAEMLGRASEIQKAQDFYMSLREEMNERAQLSGYANPAID